MQQTICDINLQIKNCKFCCLHKHRKNSVCGEGLIPSKFMFIAQAPGRIEDFEGKILIGPSGIAFDKLLESVQITRREVYLTNMIKCFLPKCRKPKQDEINACYEVHLKKELEFVKPEIIVTVGYHVTKFIFKVYNLKVPNKFGFKTTFGKLFVGRNRKILPLHHPATVVHKSKSLDELVKEYQILKILQSSCPKIANCTIHKEYEKGLIPIDFIYQFCEGNWKECVYA